MRHIIVQPSIDYYTWQIEVLINNLIEIGVNPNYIDVVCDNQKKNGNWDTLANHYNYVRFFFYDDTREKPKYISSIRPHLLAKHFKAHQYLEKEVIFYHDCDILFTKPYDASIFEGDDTWYVSDTVSYIGYNYIKSKGDDILKKMCEVVGIDEQVLIDNELNSGGAQYIMKNIDYKYWEEVYRDSENLFIKISAMNVIKKKNDPKYHEIQIWCADMWAVLWNGWKRGNNIRVHKSLDFSWSTSDIKDWDSKGIYHNAGVTEESKNMFFKGNYINSLPYKTDLVLDGKVCSTKYYEYIQKISKITVLK